MGKMIAADRNLSDDHLNGVEKCAQVMTDVLMERLPGVGAIVLDVGASMAEFVAYQRAHNEVRNAKPENAP